MSPGLQSGLIEYIYDDLYIEREKREREREEREERETVAKYNVDAADDSAYYYF